LLQQLKIDTLILVIRHLIRHIGWPLAVVTAFLPLLGHPEEYLYASVVWTLLIANCYTTQETVL